MPPTITMLKIFVELTNYDDDHRVVDRTARELVIPEASIPEPVLTFITEGLKANG